MSMIARRIRPLRQELLLLVGLGLLPLALFGVYGIAATIRGQGEQTMRSTVELSRALASGVDSELDATVDSLGAMAQSPALQAGDTRAFYDRAREEVAARPGWAAVLLADAQGRLLFTTSRPYGSADDRVVDPASLQRAIATGAPTVGTLLPGRRGIYAFAVRVPVRIGGRLAFVLTAAVKPDRFAELLANQKAPDGWIIAIFDGAGRRVARSRDQGRTLGQQATPSLARLLAQGGESGSGVSRTIEGDAVYTGFTRVPAYGWTVAVGASTALTDAALRRSLAVLVAAIAASALVCAALALRVTHRLAGDIGELRDKAVRVGAGEVVEAGASEIAEIDEMGAALHAASLRLQWAAASTGEALARADDASRAKDEFLAVLGHELRNPLAPMLTALHLMDMKAEPATERERRIMRRQIAHMRRLVDDLLDVSRVARGTLQILREPVELSHVVERAVETVQPSLAAQGRDVSVRLPPGPTWVSGDETRLVQALTNLLTNGVRFGGAASLALDVERGPQAVLGGAPGVRLAVRDSGIGMDAATLARVFEPFYQAPQPLARTAGGLGLGLAIVRTVIELHGGQVAARSDGPGRGSTFEIVLPLADAPLPEGEAPAPAHAAATGRVLVVDDNVDSATTLAETLAAAGHEVRTAHSAAEAQAVAAAFVPDVAILDIGLPDLDGYALARRLREAPGPGAPWRGRLVALTGYGQAADRERALAAGFDLHVTKPADLVALLEAVDGFMRAPGAAA
jgi:signal transduction histidine kinase/ActR/RegA family two-component response regulator